MTNLTRTMVAILTAVAMFENLNAFAQDRGSSNQSRGGPSGGGSSFFDRLSNRGSIARVTAVADERTNSIIVSAPEEMIAEIDTLISQIEGISSTTTQVRVFALQYAYAKDMATVFTDLFRDQSSSGGRGGSSSSNLSRAVAVADERTNSVVVSAPEDIMKTIERIVKEVDTMTEDVTELRVFPLRYCNAEETAKVINDVFEEQRTQTSSRNQPQRFGGGSFGFFGSRGGPSSSRSSSNQSSERRIQEETVVAVADARTNSVVVKAASEIMVQIEAMIRKMDENPAREKKVYVYSLGNADIQDVSTILQQLFPNQSGSRTGGQNTNTQGLRPTSGQTGTGTSGRPASGSGSSSRSSGRSGSSSGGGFGSLN